MVPTTLFWEINIMLVLPNCKFFQRISKVFIVLNNLQRIQISCRLNRFEVITNFFVDQANTTKPVLKKLLFLS